MAEKIQSVKGMNDLLPGQIERWHQVEERLRSIAWRYGYQEIRTPVLEKTALFKQSIGDQTDIVEKEMYVFDDAGSVSLALRPEATASTVRAGNQHGLFYNQQQRLWYMGPMFRRERPQRGRYRQFHQFGVEAFGWPGAEMDAEVIRLSARIWKELGVENVSLQLNTLGSAKTRETYETALHHYLSQYESDLDADSQRRLSKNPLRILDSKAELTQKIVADAPSILEFLDAESQAEFDALCEHLSDAGIAANINPAMVRGLDYYTSTVFEWVTDQLGAQSAVCAGGRYDGLVAARGGASTPAVGFAMGMERLVELMMVQESVAPSALLDIYLIALDSPSDSVQMGEALRDVGYKVGAFSGGKLKNHMKRADSSGARYAVIIGEQERADDMVQLKDLRGDRGQRLVARNKLIETLNNDGVS